MMRSNGERPFAESFLVELLENAVSYKGVILIRTPNVVTRRTMEIDKSLLFNSPASPFNVPLNLSLKSRRNFAKIMKRGKTYRYRLGKNALDVGRKALP